MQPIKLRLANKRKFNVLNIHEVEQQSRTKYHENYNPNEYSDVSKLLGLLRQALCQFVVNILNGLDAVLGGEYSGQSDGEEEAGCREQSVDHVRLDLYWWVLLIGCWRWLCCHFRFRGRLFGARKEVSTKDGEAGHDGDGILSVISHKSHYPITIIAFILHSNKFFKDRLHSYLLIKLEI